VLPLRTSESSALAAHVDHLAHLAVGLEDFIQRVGDIQNGDGLASRRVLDPSAVWQGSGLGKVESSGFLRSSFQAGKKLRNGHFEMLGNRQYADDGQVSLAPFNTAHVRSVQAADVRKLFLRPSSL
jgi:hypothetical protein